MKTLINYAAIAITMIAFLSVSTLNAQEWSKEQKEVWQEVENMWENWKTGDLNAAFANVHEEYLGWNNSNPMPMSRTKWVEPMKETIDNYLNRNYNIEPARILVINNAAIVHYYYSFSYVYDDSDKMQKSKHHGKWSAFFIKDGGKWFLIGDMTVEMDK